MPIFSISALHASIATAVPTERRATYMTCSTVSEVLSTLNFTEATCNRRWEQTIRAARELK